MKAFVIVIIGPTASGKTALSYNLASRISAEIINADMGQFYTPLTIGTAKPDWQHESCPAHLFDIIDRPEDMTVKEYRNKVLIAIDDIASRGKTPIIVGGSLFYIKSLLYPPVELAEQPMLDHAMHENTWDALYAIDPARATMLHPNDTYRITRALDIWRISGQLPSSYKPQLRLPFNPLLISLMPPVDLLRARICERAKQMLANDAWLQEVRNLEPEWRDFLFQKKIIGYDIMYGLLDGTISLNEGFERLCIKTNQYAKRQQTFLKKFIQDVVSDGLRARSIIEHLVLTNHEKGLNEIIALLEKSGVYDKLQYKEKQ